MNTEILMAASGCITLVSCYVAWHYAKQAAGYLRELENVDKAWDASRAEWCKALIAERDEASRLSGHIEILQDLCADIHAYTAPQKSGTAQKVARMAAGGMFN